MSEKFEPKAGAVSTVEDTYPQKVDEAQIAAAEEHSLSVKDALLNNKLVVFWCIFFGFSSIGWLVPQTSTQANRWPVTNNHHRGFDAQVNGAMIGVPQFRLTFG